jgi:hypothetical protein
LSRSSRLCIDFAEWRVPRENSIIRTSGKQAESLILHLKPFETAIRFGSPGTGKFSVTLFPDANFRIADNPGSDPEIIITTGRCGSKKY